MTSSSPSLADGFGWARWRERHWAPDHPAPVLELEQGDLNLGLATAAELHHRLYRAWMHRAWIAWSEHKKAVDAAREAAPPAPTSAPGTTPAGGSGVDLIHRYFPASEWAPAICTMGHESQFHSWAVNPSSGAAGYFQFMPSVWPGLSAAAGWGGYSALNGPANVATAAHTVAVMGWNPWMDFAAYWCPGWHG